MATQTTFDHDITKCDGNGDRGMHPPVRAREASFVTFTFESLLSGLDLDEIAAKAGTNIPAWRIRTALIEVAQSNAFRDLLVESQPVERRADTVAAWNGWCRSCRGIGPRQIMKHLRGLMRRFRP